MKAPYILALASISGFTATLLAAMGSHSLNLTEANLGLFQQASEFHFYHTFALLGAAMLAKWGAEGTARTSSLLFLAGILCFSGSLYWRAVHGPGSLGSFHWATPLGGLLLMAGWFTLAVGAIRSR